MSTAVLKKTSLASSSEYLDGWINLTVLFCLIFILLFFPNPCFRKDPVVQYTSKCTWTNSLDFFSAQLPNTIYKICNKTYILFFACFLEFVRDTNKWGDEPYRETYTLSLVIPGKAIK